jgi:nicotinate-nucleotide adenylyltransferase
VKVGLFFGSFNPIHIGHLIIANSMLENADLDQVWFVVSPQNPFKSSNSLLHEFDRMDMVEAAIEGNPEFRATDIEFHMPRPSYTVDTLTYISEKYPTYEFTLIIGEDNLKSFPKWKNSEQILDYFSLYVYPRPNAEKSELLDHPNVKKVEAPMMDISATYIRSAVKDQKSIKYLVPDKVIELIDSRGYYEN